jgi:hypothetical protein
MHPIESDPRFELPCPHCAGRMIFVLSVAISKDRRRRAYQCDACHQVLSLTVEGPTRRMRSPQPSVDNSNPRPIPCGSQPDNNYG